MSETEMIAVGEPLPALGGVEIGDAPHVVVVSWTEGERAGRTDVIDLAPILFTYRIFRPLRDDPQLFASVRVGAFGEALEWAGDDDLAIAAMTLERLAGESMSNDDFAAFMKRHRLSLDAAAAHLGISRRLTAYYARDRGIPRHIALACRYLDLRLSATGLADPSRGPKEGSAPTEAAPGPIASGRSAL